MTNDVAHGVKSHEEKREVVLLTGAGIKCRYKCPHEGPATRIYPKQNVEHIRAHHQQFRLKPECPGCSLFLGAEVHNKYRKHAAGCKAKLCMSSFAEVNFLRVQGPPAFCGERQ
jgi:hypothetical protein